MAMGFDKVVFYELLPEKQTATGVSLSTVFEAEFGQLAKWAEGHKIVTQTRQCQISQN